MDTRTSIYAAAICLSTINTIPAGSCGPMDTAKDQRVAALNGADLVGDAEPSCTANNLPVIDKVWFNQEMFCEDGLAHIVVHAEDPDREKIEYRIEMGGLLLERDEESPTGFYGEVPNPKLSYSLQLAAGDGCEIYRAAAMLDGGKYCDEKSTRALDEAYVRLPLVQN